MQILIVHRELPFPADNGGRLRAAYTTQFLAQHHEVAVICLGAEARREAIPVPSRSLEFQFAPEPAPVT